ncbi:histone acetyltransferase [Nitrosopumilus cobalaminigenes]|uniref:Histone acetyltransferase n=1 Tax=Nitrosopumilus cobalaminigenes TaxID=1470066 RepID=A0A7D5M248_9ARCH|nr:histone acetyltransferase [Nitrosopumilus cobalaminigenes]QLH02668.1 histone acetyltransferase [Nitrosopumilus cobalaminigenes]
MSDEIIIRNTTKNDASSIVKLQNETFFDLPEHARWKKEHIFAHVDKFPQGQFCAISNNEIVGSCSSFLTLRSIILKPHTWIEACGDFYFKNHIVSGDILYDADISVHPDFQRMGIANSMNDARKMLVSKLSIRSFFSGSRLSNYGKYSDQFTPDEYAQKVIDNSISDRVLSFHLSCDFKFVKLLPNYLDDLNSKNNGVLVEWINPNYKNNP